jgi:hypothetical protein
MLQNAENSVISFDRGEWRSFENDERRRKSEGEDCGVKCD